jgi:hypothetical protein
MKNAQIHSQIFIYILALIVVSVIAIIGFKGIALIIDHSQRIQLAEFEKDFSNAVSDNSNWNGVTPIYFRLPLNAVGLCFFDSTKSGPDPEYQAEIIKGLTSGNSGQNVFIIKQVQPISGENVEAFHVDNLRLKTKFLCLTSANGETKVTMTGLGVDGTQIS